MNVSPIDGSLHENYEFSVRVSACSKTQVYGPYKLNIGCKDVTIDTQHLTHGVPDLRVIFMLKDDTKFNKIQLPSPMLSKDYCKVIRKEIYLDAAGT